MRVGKKFKAVITQDILCLIYGYSDLPNVSPGPGIIKPNCIPVKYM